MNSVTSLQHAIMPDSQLATSYLPLGEARRNRTAERTGTAMLDSVSTVSKGEKAITDNMEDLLAAVASTKDRDAFHSLFEYFAPRVKSFLRGKGTTPELAEEAVQEAMLKVWRKADQFDPAKASASTWIFAIARNTRIDLIRKTTRPELDPNDPALVPDAPKPAFETVLAAKEAERIRARVAALPTEQQ